jgi:5-methyltetrahydropteroyltriglutamate--homocysteine methyltransferase
MKVDISVVGYPRVGNKRQYKWAVEKFWRSEITLEELVSKSDELISNNWDIQNNSGINKVLIGDFSFYDQVLDTATHLGIPQKRFGYTNHTDFDSYFKASRGGEVNGKNESPLEMTKWFDTNYHYLVSEINWDLEFNPSATRFSHELKLASEKDLDVIPKIIGPTTFLTLCKENDLDQSKKDKVLNAYLNLFTQLKDLGLTEILIDEGSLGVGSHSFSKDTFDVFKALVENSPLEIHLFGYFGKYDGILDEVLNSNISSIHLDLCYEGFTDEEIIEIASKKEVQLGVLSGRTIWKSNLVDIFDRISDLKLNEFSISTSCSLLHVPYSLKEEDSLNADLKNILSFAEEKLNALLLLKNSLESNMKSEDLVSYEKARDDSDKALLGRKVETIRNRVSSLTEESFERKTNREDRLELQSRELNIPTFPTTTIGSFPQTGDTRTLRKQFKSNEISESEYEEGIKEIIKETVEIQEELGLDILVHGEAERNDMVEYFGELLEGFAFSKFGWVQSYGSRCVKPPIIFGDVYRKEAMTVNWSSFAQSLTDKRMKGMLTGPVTILQWSFYRDDISKKEVAYQIGLALRDEVLDLEKNGIKIIQIDEPAIREGLPLNPKYKQEYLEWAVNSFKLSQAGVEDSTQIHSHMCYSEFDEILDAINALDVDVLSIEASRSGMDLVNPTLKEKYKGAVGPGVYDIHSPLVLEYEDALQRIQQLAKSLDVKNIWINPDCGLKTRNWKEVKESLANMIKANNDVKETIS